MVFIIEPPHAPRFPGAASKVDNLVRDAVIDVPSRPSSAKAVPRSVPIPTPAPPGLSSAQDFPSLPAPSVQPPAPPTAPRVQRKAPTKVTPATIKPVVPVVPPSGLKTTTARDPQVKPQEKEPGIGGTPESNKEPAKVKEVNTAQTDQDSTEANPNVPPAPLSTVSEEITTSKQIDKRQRPDKIDIGAAKDASKKSLESAVAEFEASKNKGKETASTTPSGLSFSRPATPGTAASQTSASSFARPNQPRTIRVLPTSETPPRPISSSSPGIPSSPFPSHGASRQPSLASINRPGTPASERFSDNASFASTSLSRANSPPPSRVGTAPVRQLTKAQQKKDRQARARQAEEASRTEDQPSKVEETVQAPIIGRKKKTKKPTTRTSTADSTPAATRPTSPDPAEDKKMDLPPVPAKETKKQTAKPTEEAKKPEEPSPLAPIDHGQPQKSNLTPSALYNALVSTNAISPTATDLFKPVSSFAPHHTSLTDLTTHPLPTLTPAEIRLLDAGTAIALEHGQSSTTRIIVLPDRRILRGLTPSQAHRYLDLHNRLGSPPLSNLDALMPRLQLPSPVAPPANTNEKGERELINRFASTMMLDARLPASASATAEYSPAASRGNQEMAARGEGVSVEEAEAVLASHRREMEGVEKKLNAVIRRNRRVLLVGGAH